MRDQGRLVEWFDDKGYGFIQPNDASKDRVFLHIKDFAKTGPRPLLGCALSYQVSVDGQGRYRAQQVQYLKAADIKSQQSKGVHSKKQGHATALKPIQKLAIAYILALAVLTLMGWLSGIYLLLISMVNALTYWLYAQDKEAAQLGQRRIAENTLHVLAFLGGWPAAWLAQQKLRHKTQKQPFQKIYLCSIGFNILLIIWLVSPLNSLNL